MLLGEATLENSSLGDVASVDTDSTPTRRRLCRGLDVRSVRSQEWETNTDTKERKKEPHTERRKKKKWREGGFSSENAVGTYLSEEHYLHICSKVKLLQLQLSPPPPSAPPSLAISRSAFPARAPLRYSANMFHMRKIKGREKRRRNYIEHVALPHPPCYRISLPRDLSI